MELYPTFLDSYKEPYLLDLRENIESLYYVKQKLTTLNHATGPLRENSGKLVGGRVPQGVLPPGDDGHGRPLHRELAGDLARRQRGGNGREDLSGRPEALIPASATSRATPPSRRG